MGVDTDPALLRPPQSPVSAAGPAAAGAGPTPKAAKTARPNRPVEDWVAEATSAAEKSRNLDELATAIDQFEGCPLKAGSRNTVVFDGQPGAPVLVIGEGPGAEEDRTGKPFVGRAGALLDQMLLAIGLSRQTNLLITNVNYWRPPRNRNPEREELAVCRPFVDRFVDLAAPKLIIAAGAVPAQSLLGTRTGIMKLRGTRAEFSTPGDSRLPLFPILHPAFLLRRPQEKSRAWRDLQFIEDEARGLGALD